MVNISICISICIVMIMCVCAHTTKERKKRLLYCKTQYNNQTGVSTKKAERIDIMLTYIYVEPASIIKYANNNHPTRAQPAHFNEFLR